jgi:hypothetical protein
MPLEILHRALVLLRGGTAGERAEIAPPAGPRILPARVQPVLSGRELADHPDLLAERPATLTAVCNDCFELGSGILRFDIRLLRKDYHCPGLISNCLPA